MLQGILCVALAVATAPVFKRNFKPMGAWGDHGEEASPFFMNGKLYMMQSIMVRYKSCVQIESRVL